jgi:pyruvate/2-oxoglutarate dehydrogenase complex dihydrolipoamide acyltransferase (E2) component
MKDGRIEEHHHSIGAKVQQGDIVLTVQIHDRTLNFKSPSAGRLASIVSMATLPLPGDWLFSILLEVEQDAFSETITASATDIEGSIVDPEASVEPVEIRQKALESSRWPWIMFPVRMVLAALMWLTLGSVLAGVYALASDGDSPIGGWLPEQRISVLDGAMDKASDLHIKWIKSRQLAKYETEKQQQSDSDQSEPKEPD